MSPTRASLRPKQLSDAEQKLENLRKFNKETAATSGSSRKRKREAKASDGRRKNRIEFEPEFLLPAKISQSTIKDFFKDSNQKSAGNVYFTEINSFFFLFRSIIDDV